MREYLEPKPKDLSSKTCDYAAFNYFSHYYYFYSHEIKLGRVLFLSNPCDFVVRFSAFGDSRYSHYGNILIIWSLARGEVWKEFTEAFYGPVGPCFHTSSKDQSMVLYSRHI